MIRLFDIVMLIRCHDWHGRVLSIEHGEALVLHPHTGMVEWMPLEFLELRPGQMEEMSA